MGISVKLADKPKHEKIWGDINGNMYYSREDLLKKTNQIRNEPDGLSDAKQENPTEHLEENINQGLVGPEGRTTRTEEGNGNETEAELLRINNNPLLTSTQKEQLIKQYYAGI